MISRGRHHTDHKRRFGKRSARLVGTEPALLFVGSRPGDADEAGDASSRVWRSNRMKLRRELDVIGTRAAI
jgi:hypothetical protein